MKPKSWMISVIGVLILIMMVLPKITKKTNVSNFDTAKFGNKEDGPRYVSPNWDKMEKVGNIWWELEEDEIPINDKATGLVWDYVDMEPLRGLMKERGMVYNQDKSRETKAEVWENEQQRSTVTYRPQTRILEWSTTVEKVEDLGEGKLPTRETAEEAVREILRNLSSIKTINELETREISGKRLVYPRWVAAEDNIAQAWQISLNYTISGKEIINSEGDSVKAVVGRGGKILKLKTVWPLTVDSAKSETLRLKTIEEIKGSVGQIRVWQIKGGEKTDLLYDTGLSNVGINYINLVYWWEPGEKWLMPYYLLSGNGLMAGEPVGVELVTPAGKIE